MRTEIKKGSSTAGAYQHTRMHRCDGVYNGRGRSRSHGRIMENFHRYKHGQTVWQRCMKFEISAFSFMQGSPVWLTVAQ